MRKRIFCALWMAFFANVAAFPLWLFMLNGGAKRPLEALSIALVLAFAGAVVGGLVQPLAIGRHSNVVYATLTGALCALLAIPLLMITMGLIVDPPSFTSARSLYAFAEKGVRATPRAVEDLWFIVVPVGAIGGLIVQWAWMDRQNKRSGSPRGGLRAGPSDDPYIEGD